jgi:hypothetical protein
MCLYALCSSFSVICVYELKDDERGKACGTYEETCDTYIVLVGKSEGWRPLGRPTHRWKNNIKINIPETVSEVLTVINLAQDRPSSWLF